MKKIFTVLAVTLIILLAGVMLAPSEAQAQMGLDSLDSYENFGLYQDDLNLPSLGMDGMDNQGDISNFSLGFIWQYRIVNSPHLVGLDITFDMFAFALGWYSSVDWGYFYIHGGILYLAYTADFIGINFGLQVYFHVSNAGPGFGFRIPIEFEFALFPFPLTFYFAMIPGIGIMTPDGMVSSSNLFQFAIAFGLRFYF
jgi:hypothetical protein